MNTDINAAVRWGMAGQELKGERFAFPFSNWRRNMVNNRIALFIDGGYLDSVLLRHGKARINYSLLAAHM
jgi:hypothetical protein